MMSLKKTKIKMWILYIFAIVSILFGCCSIIQFKSPKVFEIVENIKKNTNLSSMDKANKSKLRKLYGISYRKLEEFVFYAPKTNMEANELLILKVKNQDDIDYLRERIDKRIEKQCNSFKNYEPKQYNLLENHILKVKGKYIIFIVSKNADEIMKDIDNSFK